GTGPTGSGSFPIAVPNDSALQGLKLHLQLMSGPGTNGRDVDKISNKLLVVAGASATSTQLDALLGDNQTPPGPGRALMAVFPIAGSDGEYLLAGGGVGNILGATGLRTSEIFSSRELDVRPGPL